MTAANLIVGPSAAYLIQDEAWYRPSDHVILELGSKIAKSTRLSVAVGTQGVTTHWGSQRICQWLEKCSSQSELLSTATDLGDELAREIRASVSDGHSLEARVLVALFSAERMEPAGYVMNVPTEIAPNSGSRFPRACRGLQKMDYFIQPAPRSLPMSGPIGKRQARDLVDKQRELKSERGLRGVGGRAELVIVDACGVSSTIVRRWPDRIGDVVGQRPWWKVW